MWTELHVASRREAHSLCDLWQRPWNQTANRRLPILAFHGLVGKGCRLKWGMRGLESGGDRPTMCWPDAHQLLWASCLSPHACSIGAVVCPLLLHVLFRRGNWALGSSLLKINSPTNCQRQMRSHVTLTIRGRPSYAKPSSTFVQPKGRDWWGGSVEDQSSVPSIQIAPHTYANLKPGHLTPSAGLCRHTCTHK